MTSVSVWAGAALIAAWNLVSFIIEYYIRYKIYHLIPQLQMDKHPQQQQQCREEPLGFEEGAITGTGGGHRGPHHQQQPGGDAAGAAVTSGTFDGSERHEDCGVSESDDATATVAEVASAKRMNSLEMLYRGWTVYISQDVAPAGLGLAFLYLTVLGFDSVTVGYGYSQGASEALMGGMYGLGGLFGVMGTLVFPRLRSRVGIERTGLIAGWCQITVLTFCVASVFAPGSPFAPYEAHRVSGASGGLTVWTNTTSHPVPGPGEAGTVTTSLILLLIGLILQRFGLWMFDLSVSQLLQERVPASDVGAVNGVQGSLNQLMDMIKFILVIALPGVDTFGYLVIVSVAAVCLGNVSYSFYSYKIRGHLLHMERLITWFTPITKLDLYPSGSGNTPDDSNMSYALSVEQLLLQVK